MTNLLRLGSLGQRLPTYVIEEASIVSTCNVSTLALNSVTCVAQGLHVRYGLGP